MDSKNKAKERTWKGSIESNHIHSLPILCPKQVSSSKLFCSHIDRGTGK